MKFRLGLRTIKTAVAVILALILADGWGASDGKLIFSMLGVMAAVQPTFKESWESCLTQVVGLALGAVAAVLLQMLPLNPVLASGIGILVVIVFYSSVGLRFSPSLACIMVVTICIGSDMHPMEYALDRIWDTTIGLTVGMLINTLVFPYDNSRQIRYTVHILEKEVMGFLGDTFDGDDKRPDVEGTNQRIRQIARELEIYSNQRLPFHGKRYALQLRAFRRCQENANQLLAHMEVLSHMERVGYLNQENYLSLMDWGVALPPPGEPADPITNYHVEKILELRQALLSSLAIQDGHRGINTNS